MRSLWDQNHSPSVPRKSTAMPPVAANERGADGGPGAGQSIRLHFRLWVASAIEQIRNRLRSLKCLDLH